MALTISIPAPVNVLITWLNALDHRDWSLVPSFHLDFLGLPSADITIFWTKGIDTIFNENGII